MQAPRSLILTLLRALALLGAAGSVATAQIAPSTSSDAPAPETSTEVTPETDATEDEEPSIFDRTSAQPVTTQMETEVTPIIGGDNTAWAPPITDARTIRSGAFTLVPSIAYRYMYGDGVLARPGQRHKTSVHSLIPTFQVGVGDVWRAFYAPSFTWYSSDALRDTVNHLFRISGETSYQAWDFGAYQTYSRTNAPLAETGSQTELQRYITRLAAGYEVNSRLTLDFDLAHELRDPESRNANANLSRVREWSSSAWANYQTRPWMVVGAGVTVGYVDVDRIANNAFTRLEGQVTVRSTQKTSFSLRAGGERRFFPHSDDGSINNPIVGGSLTYTPVETTRLSLDVERAVGTSFYQSQMTERETIGLGLQQRLLGRFLLNLNYAFRDVTYLPWREQTVERQDDIETFSASLGTQVWNRVSVAALYRTTTNDTSIPELNYDSDQVGFEVRYSF